MARDAEAVAAGAASHSACSCSRAWAAKDRFDNEHGQTFYGTSFICDERGDILAELGRDEEGVVTAKLDLARMKRHRAAFGFFRDRRPELYGRLVADV